MSALACPLTPSPLSAREEDVVQGLLRGISNQVIAAELCISLSTLQHHLTAIYTKLGCHNRTQAVLYILHHCEVQGAGRDQ